MANYEELLAQKHKLQQEAAELDRKIKAARGEVIASVLAEVRRLMGEHGLTIADVASVRPAFTTPRSTSLKGSTVAPKYRNKDTGETWTGRGLKPNWLKKAVEAGRSLEEFKI